MGVRAPPTRPIKTIDFRWRVWYSFAMSNACDCKGAGVVHCKKDEFDVYIGRPSKWGNPFVMGKDGDRETVVKKYKEWLLKQPKLMAQLHELRGKVLGCWCAPQACHGDVLVELANMPQ